MSEYAEEPWHINELAGEYIICNHITLKEFQEKHGKEAPWYGGDYSIVIRGHEGNAKRIVQCVNAMAGIEEPIYVMRALRGLMNEFSTFTEKSIYQKAIKQALFPKEEK